MREIKFRAWDKYKKFMYEIGRLDFPINSPDYENIEIMQFTGLLDKNGKEIYEGDIIRVPKSVMDRIGGSILITFVQWSDTSATWMVGRNTHIANTYLWLLNKCCEVIGNIYENKDLLK